jgi:hypothetical protein
MKENRVVPAVADSGGNGVRGGSDGTIESEGAGACARATVTRAQMIAKVASSARE